MAGQRVRLEVTERETTGSRVSKRLRKEGLVPGVLYGSGKPRAFVVDERELRRALGGEHGTHAILDVVLEGQQTAHHAILKDYQLDPRRSALLHVDLHEVRLDRPIQTQVAVELTGDAKGVGLGGLLTQVVREVTVEALPMAVPERLEVDVAELDIGDSVRISDIVQPEGMTILDDPESVVASVAAPRRIEEELPEEEAAAEGEEAEAAGEAEAEAEEPETEPAE
jgi:large subunit ribosomal protein L25